MSLTRIALAALLVLVATPLAWAGGQAAPENATTLDAVLGMLLRDTPEADIRAALQKSPTTFVIGAREEAALKKAGASAELIAFMKGLRGTSADRLTDLAIVLDCSGSMSEQTKEGPTKMEVAKKVVGDLVGRLPDRLRVTFIIYGHDKELKCNAVKVVRPLKEMDAAGRSELQSVIASLQPTGSTPIALSLRTAGKELAARPDAACGLVLITDGIETCQGDPAAEAAKLDKTLNLSFGVRVVGFGLNEQESKAVEEIAKKSRKGKFYPAAGAKELQEAITKVLEEVPEAKPVPKEEAVAKARDQKPDEEDSEVAMVEFVEPSAGLPKLKKIALVAHDGYSPDSSFYAPLFEVTKYGQAKRKPGDGTKYDLWYCGEGAMPVRMVSGYAFKEGKLIRVNPDRYLGLVSFEGKGLDKPKLIAVTQPEGYAPDSQFFSPVQTAKEFGQPMVVPAGSYDLWYVPADGGKPEKSKANFKVEAGKTISIK